MTALGKIGGGVKKFFGRTLPQFGQKIGRQLTPALKQLPGAFKDTSKVYSDLERKTHGVPIVSDLFGFAGGATNAIGHLLGGRPDKAAQPALQAVGSARKIL